MYYTLQYEYENNILKFKCVFKINELYKNGKENIVLI